MDSPPVTELRESRSTFRSTSTDECRCRQYSTKTANVQPGDTVAVFGLGAVGLAVVQGAVSRNAARVIGIDTNDNKKEWAEKFGATEFINPMKLEKGTSIVEHLVKITDGGLDHTLCVAPATSTLID